MDRENVTRMLLTMAVVVIAYLLYQKYFPSHPPTPGPQAQTAAPAAANVPSGQSAAPALSATELGAGLPPGAVEATGLSVAGQSAVQAETAQLGGATWHGPYAMGVELTPNGGAIRHIELSDYFANVAARAEANHAGEKFQLIQPEVKDATGANYVTRSFVLTRLDMIEKDNQGGRELYFSRGLGDAVWQLEPGATAEQATYRLEIEKDGKPFLTLRRSYRLHARRTPKEGDEFGDGLGYALDLEQEFTDHSGTLRTVGFTMRGPEGLVTEESRGEDRLATAGFADERQRPEFKTGGDTEDEKKRLFPARLDWVGMVDKYFAVALIANPPNPEESAGRFESAAAYLAYSDAKINSTSVSKNPGVAATSYRTELEYAATVKQTAGGTVTVSPSQERYFYDAKPTITASAAPGYVFANWVLSGSGTVTRSTSQATLTVGGNVTLSANFTSGSNTGSAQGTGGTTYLPAAAGGDEGAARQHYTLFAGPKDTRLLDLPAFKDYGLLQLIRWSSGCCFISVGPVDGLIGGIAKIMVAGINGIAYFVVNKGVAIIILTFLVWLITFPIYRYSQVAMLRMQDLAPEVAKLKEQCKDDPKKLQLEQMKLYRERGANPIMSCVPMMLQMPIWVALYTGLGVAITLRQAPFVGWIKDLAQPDAALGPFHPVDIPIVSFIGSWASWQLNILPILVVVAMFLQMKLQPQPSSTPEMEKQQRIMKYMMPLMMFFFFYIAPSGLNLYIVTNATLGYFGQKWIRRRHELEKLRPKAAKPPKPKSRIMAFIEEKMEDAQRLQKTVGESKWEKKKPRK